MKFDNFELHASIYMTKAYCRCGNGLVEVSNGLFSRAMFCTECKNVYTLKLIKVPDKKISEKFVEQAEKDANR